jgi:hypothetical protein
VYAWVERTLVRRGYAGLGRADKGVVRQYVARMTGLSRAQVTRLIAGHRKTGRVKAVEYQRTKFATRYTPADVGLLAYVDQAHGNLSGPATRRILEREYTDYGQAVYRRLAGISVAQLYRFRNTGAYRQRNTSYQPTRPTVIPIGERRKPQPQTPCIKAIGTAARASITSTRWTRSRNGRLSPPRRRSANPG